MSPISNKPDHVPKNLVYDLDMFAVEQDTDDLHLAWKRVQETAPPIFWTPRNGGHWVVTKGAHIREVQIDHAHFSTSVLAVPARPELRFVPINLDPPEHAPYRKIIMPAFLPRSVKALEQRTRDLAISLIESFIDRGHCEFMSEFARILPVTVFLRIVDLPESDRELLMPWAETMVRDPDEQVKGEAFQKGCAYLEERLAARRREPGDDLLSSLVQAKIGDRPLTDQEVLSMAILLLFGGLDTVASMMGFIARFLAMNPEHRHRLIEQPALIPHAVEEMLRRHGVSNTTRRIRADHEFHGVLLKEGDILLQPGALYGLDEEIVDEPLSVNFDRPAPIAHVTFGSGPHSCPGAVLARRELIVFVEEWLLRIPDFEIRSGTKPVVQFGSVSGVVELQLSWSPRTTTRPAPDA